ncbi:DUF2459 domain-containing protein [Verrucomicrobiota bacterium sgz303538]
MLPFWPRPSALHVVPLHEQPELTYHRSDIVRLTLAADNFSMLRGYIEAQFALHRQGRPILLGPGFSERSACFLGAEKFYFPKCATLGSRRDFVRRAFRCAFRAR